MSHDTKHHSDATEQAIKDVDRHESATVDPVPMPEQSTHSHSHAAHLHTESEPDTKRRLPDLRQSPAPGALRQPPQNLSRIGKEHR